MYRVIIRMLYNGLKFHGFQRQPGVKTVEGALEELLLNEECIEDRFTNIRYSASGRTDRNVHAISQVVVFDSKCSADRIVEVINKHYYPDIIAWGYRYDSFGEFNARYWAVYREYIYVERAAVEEYDISLMDEACKYFIGLKDFSFLSLPRNVKAERQLFKIIIKKKNDFIIYRFIGESYARFMIRKLIGLLKSIGIGQLTLNHLRQVIKGHLKIKIPTYYAKPENLALLNVKYPIYFYTPKQLIHLLMKGLAILSKESIVFEYLYNNIGEVLRN